MRVMWFAPTPSLLKKVVNSSDVGGGWVEGLESELNKRENIQLAVCFLTKNDLPKLVKNRNTSYFPIYNNEGNLALKYLNRIRHKIEMNNELGSYLDVIKEFNPDIVQIFGTERSFGKIINFVDVPIILYLQGIITVYNRKWFAGVESKFTSPFKNIKKFVRGSGYYHAKKNFEKMVKREQDILGNVKFLLGGTDWDRRIAKVLAPNAKYFHINAALRNEFYNNNRNEDLTDRNVVFSTIQANIYKGFETIVESTLLLAKKMDKYFSWRIAGISKDDDIVKIVLNSLKLDKLPNQITLLGRISASEIVQELNNTRVFVHPSHIDNWPTSVSEAMLIGVPVIATYTGGTGSLIKDKHDGILLQDGDPWALAGAIEELLEDKNLSKTLAENARQIALKRHDRKAIVDRLLKIYKQIIDQV